MPECGPLKSCPKCGTSPTNYRTKKVLDRKTNEVKRTHYYSCRCYRLTWSLSSGKYNLRED